MNNVMNMRLILSKFVCGLQSNYNNVSIKKKKKIYQSVVACNLLRYHMVNERVYKIERNVLQPTQSQKPNSPTLEIKKPKTPTQHSPIQKKQTWNSSAKTFQNYKRTPKLFPNYIFAPKFFKITFFL